MTFLKIWRVSLKEKYLKSMNNNIDINQLMQAAIQQQQMRSSDKKGLSYCEILSLILVTLWCTGHITCSIIVPFIPLLVPVVIYLVVFIIAFINRKVSKK